MIYHIVRLLQNIVIEKIHNMEQKSSIQKHDFQKFVSNNIFVLKDLKNRGRNSNEMEPVTSHETKEKADAYSEEDKKVIGNVMGVWGSKNQRKQSYTVADDFKSGMLNWKQQGHIRKVREDNMNLFTHTERASKDHDHFIRQVRQTGVTLITNKARTYGFGRPEEEHLWANFGQGAPEVGPIPGAPEKSMTCTMDEITMEYVKT